ncbi:hypothetical protein [Mesotoga sp.]|uniref:hypothetical protein n=1 Tax=Mesotoga sp. TaxID=2053577 RepID=UPI00345E27D6
MNATVLRLEAFSGPPSKVLRPPKEKKKNQSRSDAPKNIGGSDAASQEVMPGKSSGEVMLACARKKEILDAIAHVAGSY